MGRVGGRAHALAVLLTRAGLIQVEPASVQRLRELPKDRVEAIRDLYDALGGVSDRFDALRPGSWDLAFSRGLVVELDEEQHFNRYRLHTLTGAWANGMPWTADYIDYCERFEADCLRFGKGQGRWRNHSSERFFGVGAEPGNFQDVGSPRWRQRALYDAFKDAVPGVRLARISVHDRVGDLSLDSILRSTDETHAGAVLDLVRTRTTPA
jgi:hypothetical protein